MAKIFRVADRSTENLLRRKSRLLASLAVPPNVCRASSVEQYLTCGKSNCRCQRGEKHGPFAYLVQSLHTRTTRKFLLKTAAQREQARAAISAYTQLQESLEELSQINSELLRRGESLDG